MDSRPDLSAMAAVDVDTNGLHTEGRPAPDFMLGMTRSMFSMAQFNEQKEDYTTSLKGLEPMSLDYEAKLAECHDRGAKRAAQVVEMQRGIYVKGAQFMASLRGGSGDSGIPLQYVERLSKFTDDAPCKKASEITEVLKDVFNLGSWPEGAFDKKNGLLSLEETPVAAASLAQVHRGRLRAGPKVAIKIQYPELRKEMDSDFAVFKTMGAQIKEMAQGYDLMWVVEDLEKTLQRELDFLKEAGEAEKTKEQLSHLRPHVHVPAILREFCSQRVLTMEWCEGLLKANDPIALRGAGLDPTECAELLCNTFAEMIFIHGRVHADPHAGNIYFRARRDVGGVTRPQLVILDHGLYHDLSEGSIRPHFCKYWQACCAKDNVAVDQLGKMFAGDLHRFLPVILSPLFILGGSEGVTLAEIASASEGRIPDSVTFTDIADFIVATRHAGGNLCGLLHALGYIRNLTESLNFPETTRVRCMLKYALLGGMDQVEVPRELGFKDQCWVNWRIAVLNGQLQVLAPIARVAGIDDLAEDANSLTSCVLSSFAELLWSGCCCPARSKRQRVHPEVTNGAVNVD